MSTRRLLAMAVFAVVVFPLLAGVVSAHHSKAFYGKEMKTLKGTVVEYKWRNPHVFIVWDVKDANGKVVQWIGELSSVTSSIADGMGKNSLKPGDEIIVTAAPSKTGTPESLIEKVVKADGKVVVDLSRQNIREP